MRKHLAVALVIALSPLTLAACGAGGGEEAGSESRERMTDAGDESELAAASRPAESTLVLPGGPRVIQTASLRVSVREGGFESAVQRARTIAAGLGGFVVSSSATQGPGRRLVEGTLELRVPARRYADAMGALARLGRVEVREESGQDVSQEFVQVRGRMRFLEDQVAFATISLTLAERRPDAAGDDGWQIVDAWRDGAHAFVFVVGRIFVILATIAPVLLLGAVAFIAARFARRRLLLRA
jgi:hypothetical protein